MKDIKKLLKIKEQLKKNTPDFIRQDHQIKRLKKCWRAPKGIHSKLRRKFKGHIKQPSIGYRSPKPARFLTPQGLKPILIKNINDVKYLDPKTSIAILSHVGLKKKLEILKKIKELKISILNMHDIDSFIKKSEDELAERKKQRTESKKQKEKKTKEQKPEAKKEEKPKTEEELKLEEEAKKKKEKEEQRKILEKPK